MNVVQCERCGDELFYAVVVDQIHRITVRDGQVRLHGVVAETETGEGERLVCLECGHHQNIPKDWEW